MNQTVEELSYIITVKTDEFLNGKRSVEQNANDMRNNLRRTSNETEQSLRKTTSAFGQFSEAGSNAFRGVQLGAAKFLGVALTLEGARRMFASTTTDLVRLGNVSGFLGISARSLQGFERAAQAVGVSSQSMGGSLARIKNAQLWARTGMGAPDESTIAIQQLQGETGVNIIGASDPKQGLLRQAEALRQLNRDRAQVYWQRMGGQDDMFNLMYSGNLSTLQQEFEKQSNATPAAIKQAMDVTKTLQELKASADGLAQEFVRIFGKDINEAMNEFSDWVKNNQGNILGFFQEGAKWAREFANAINGSSNALHSFFQITDNFNLISGFDKPLIDIPGMASESKNNSNVSPEVRAIIDQYRKNGSAKSDEPGLIDSIKDYMQQERLRRMKKQGLPQSAPSAEPGVKQAPQGLTPGATNPEAAYPQSQQSAESLSRFLSSIGIGSAGAASITPTLNRRPPVMTSSQVDPALMSALMMTESGGNPLARNMRSGATGAYQFMKGTARDLGLVVDESRGIDERLDPEKSRAAASMYMSQLLKRYNGNVDYALKAYNWGMGNMDAWVKTGRGINGQVMPMETQQYSGRVAGYYRKMANGAMMPGNTGGAVDQSQTSTTSIGTVYVQGTPETVDQLTRSVQEQVSRSHVTVTFAGANNPA